MIGSGKGTAGRAGGTPDVKELRRPHAPDPVLTTRRALFAGFAASLVVAAGVGAFPQARAKAQSAGLLTPTVRVGMPEGPY